MQVAVLHRIQDYQYQAPDFQLDQANGVGNNLMRRVFFYHNPIVLETIRTTLMGMSGALGTFSILYFNGEIIVETLSKFSMTFNIGCDTAGADSIGQLLTRHIPEDINEFIENIGAYGQFSRVKFMANKVANSLVEISDGCASLTCLSSTAKAIDYTGIVAEPAIGLLKGHADLLLLKSKLLEASIDLPGFLGIGYDYAIAWVEAFDQVVCSLGAMYKKVISELVAAIHNCTRSKEYLEAADLEGGKGMAAGGPYVDFTPDTHKYRRICFVLKGLTETFSSDIPLQWDVIKKMEIVVPTIPT